MFYSCVNTRVRCIAFFATSFGAVAFRRVRTRQLRNGSAGRNDRPGTIIVRARWIVKPHSHRSSPIHFSRRRSWHARRSNSKERPTVCRSVGNVVSTPHPRGGGVRRPARRVLRRQYGRPSVYHSRTAVVRVAFVAFRSPTTRQT